MNNNSSYINISGTRIGLINIESHKNGDFIDNDLKLLESGNECVESLKRNDFDPETPFNVQQGSVACFGLVITHLGEHPSPFWFDKYKRLSITSLKIIEASNSASGDFKRTDSFDSSVFPEDKCLTSEDDNPFILHLRFVPIQVKDYSIGKVVSFELHASHDGTQELSNVEPELSEPFKKFKLTGKIIVNQPLKVYAFVKSNIIFIELLNDQENLDIEIEHLGVENIKATEAKVDFPFLLNPGNQLNVSIPLDDGLNGQWKVVKNFDKIFIRWNLCQNFNEKYTLTTTLEPKIESQRHRDTPISITCSVGQIKDSKVTLEINVRVTRRMELFLRILEDEEPSHYNKLIPLHDYIKLGVVDVGETKSHSLYFYYVTEGLHQSPKIEVKDKISDKIYKIGNKIFSVSLNDLN